MQDYFHQLADEIGRRLQGDEVYTATFSAEDSDFVRFNRSQVRQAGTVSQRSLSVDLISGRRHAVGGLTLAGSLALDRPRLDGLLADLRDQRAHLPEDPYLLYSTEVTSSERVMPNRLPDRQGVVAAVQEAGRGRDLVGIHAQGGIHAGFANSLGQRNWYSNYNFNLDWSFYHQKDKAVKTGYAGFDWRPEEFDRKVGWAAEQLQVLAHPPRTIPPGRYRVFLAPTALNDIVGLLGWDGFGLKAHRTRHTPLLKLTLGEAQLNPALTVVENTAQGVAPNFQEAGYIRPDRVTLIEKGQFRDCLVSPRSAREYGVPTNGASLAEAPQSLDVAAGSLGRDRVLSELDTGLYVNNVWYLNYSDRTACRTTGMTRFATFWVEYGRIVAPVNVMRFDETLYRMLGSELVGLTSERDLLLDPDTYHRRSTSSSHVPGALVDGFTLTL